jgi:serine/threonine protein kinase
MSSLPGVVRPAAGDPAPGPARTIRLPAAAYLLLDEAGRGGMAVAYRAVEVGSGRVVALKTARSGVAPPPRVRACFRAEARALARLQHPNIVKVHGYGEPDGVPCLALEYLAGGNLTRQLAGRPAPPDRAAELVYTLAGAVAHAHQRGVVHCDLKPANVAFTAGAVPKLIDFGLARLPDDPTGPEEEGVLLGTPAYMAPEQIEGRPQKVGAAADVYGLGAVLYELLTGRPPFRAPTRTATLGQVCRREPVPPGAHQPGVPVDLEAICLCCLRKEPGRRYPGALDLAEGLHAFLRRQVADPGRRRSA